MSNLVELVLEELCAGVKDLIEKNIGFKDILKGIQLKLGALKPVLKEMEASDGELDRSKEELKGLKEIMESGIELIRKCSKLRGWDIFHRYKYANKLIEWDKKFQAELGFLALYTARNAGQALVLLSRMENFLEIVNRVLRSQQPSEPKALMSTTSCTVLVPEAPRFTVGLETHLMELKRKFFNDGVSMLVVTAPGGCGKTTLANMFYHDKEVKGKFKEKIFYVTVAKKSNNIILQELCQQMGSQESLFQSEEDAFNWLQSLVKETGQYPLLLILDDVWAESKSLLRKFNQISRQSNLNILVTTRFSFPQRFGSSYSLQALTEEDAMALFRHSAFGKNETIYVSQDLQKKILDRCKRCPLAIRVVGESLCGQSIESWRKRESELSEGESILDTEVEVLLCLKSSLEALDDQNIKECFLDLGAFPEDQRIPATALIDMWAELYGLNEDYLSIQCLQELATRSLATLIVTRKVKMEADDYYTEHFVSHHDMLRDLALFQAKLDPYKTRLILDKTGKVPKGLTEVTDQNHKSIHPRILSISSDAMFSTSLYNIHLPEVEVLVLNFHSQHYALPKFVAEMKNLKVVIVTNHGFLPAELSNFQLLDSLPKLKRIRLERISIPSIAKNRVKLQSLMKISLFMCSIGQAFCDSFFQISEAFPILEELNIDYCSDLVELPADLCNLIQLTKLSITHCHKLSALPDEIGKLINLELLRLKSCTDLVTFPASTRNLEKLEFLDISDCISIKELPKDIGELSSLIKINMRQCSRVEDLPESVFDLQQLKEVICDEDKKDLWECFRLKINIRVLKEEYDLIDVLHL